MTKHINIIIGLVTQCQKEGTVIKTSFLTIAPMIIGAVVLPSIAIRILEKNYKGTFLGTFIPILKNTAVSDKAIAERIDLALKAISIAPNVL